MPGVTPESCVAEAQAIIASWRRCADTLVLSSPQFENDTEVDETPLLPAAAMEFAVPASPPTRERLAFDAASFEPAQEAPMPPLATRHVKVGRDFSSCRRSAAFRAFGELRLGASPHEEPQAGFDRRLRGIVLHRALQSLWDRLGSQDALAALDATTRSGLVAEAVDAALGHSTPAGTGAVTTALEREWQRNSVERLLALDLARPPFLVVETERAHMLAIGGLELPSSRRSRGSHRRRACRHRLQDSEGSGLRLARRADRCAAIAALCGPASGPSDWNRLRRRRCRGREYVGVGATPRQSTESSLRRSSADGGSARRSSRGQEITSHWRAWLGRLAGLCRGSRQCRPEARALTCRHCHLAALCRVEAVSPGRRPKRT